MSHHTSPSHVGDTSRPCVACIYGLTETTQTVLPSFADYITRRLWDSCAKLSDDVCFVGGAASTVPAFIRHVLSQEVLELLAYPDATRLEVAELHERRDPTGLADSALDLDIACPLPSGELAFRYIRRLINSDLKEAESIIAGQPASCGHLQGWSALSDAASWKEGLTQICQILAKDSARLGEFQDYAITVWAERGEVVHCVAQMDRQRSRLAFETLQWRPKLPSDTSRT